MQKQFVSSTPIKLSWVKSHADKSPWKNISNLSAQKLSRDEIFNVWCNYLALEEWKHGITPNEDPKVNPFEQWALYSHYPSNHKITGELVDCA